jgi:hypothetical protein
LDISGQLKVSNLGIGLLKTLKVPGLVNIYNEALRAKRTSTDKFQLSDYFPSEEVHDFRQIYHKPIGVLTDTQCYSSCDIFAAAIQDEKIGRVFGEADNTGGGGATVLTLKNNVNRPLPPQVLKIPSNFEMNVGFIQLKRKNGVMLESRGVSSETRAPLSADDIITQGITSQWNRIALKLRDLGRVSGQSNVSFSVSPEYPSHKSLYVNVARNVPVNFVVKVSGVGSVSLFCDNVLVFVRNFAVSSTVSTFSMPYTLPAAQLNLQQSVIVPCVFQVQKADVTLFNVKKTLRVVPGRFKIASSATGIDLLAPSSQHAVENNLAPQFGW